MQTETIVELQSTLDDCSPQVIGYVLERALELGALDAYTTPVQMKKNRPGVLLTLLARPELQHALAELLLTETTTLGVRFHITERLVAKRSVTTVDTSYGPIRVKASGDRALPEYEDCRAAARRHGVPLQRVQDAARRALHCPPEPR
ncbi:MAG: DUF111 family protein [Acidobacteria bacterium]|nr:MAG: DUF111 family protein [Acidobacteriota bacterium]